MYSSRFTSNENNLKEKRFIYLFIFTSDFFTISVNHFDDYLAYPPTHNVLFFSPVARYDESINSVSKCTQITRRSLLKLKINMKYWNHPVYTFINNKNKKKKTICLTRTTAVKES